MVQAFILTAFLNSGFFSNIAIYVGLITGGNNLNMYWLFACGFGAGL